MVFWTRWQSYSPPKQMPVKLKNFNILSFFLDINHTFLIATQLAYFSRIPDVTDWQNFLLFCNVWELGFWERTGVF